MTVTLSLSLLVWYEITGHEEQPSPFTHESSMLLSGFFPPRVEAQIKQNLNESFNCLLLLLALAE